MEFSETASANRNASIGAINSRRGMLTDLIGVTLALAVTRATEICPLTCPYLALLTAVRASRDASTKV